MRIVTCTVGIALAALVAACSGEDALREASPAITAAPTPPISTAEPLPVAGPPPETGLPPVGSVGGWGLAAGAPGPEPAVDADDCARRWNAGANAGVRRSLGRSGRGAFVRLDGEFGGCAIAISRTDPSGVGRVTLFEEVEREVFAATADAGGMSAPTERGVGADGRILQALGGGPPAATVNGAGMGVASTCWPDVGCRDAVMPACGDGRTPRAIALAGSDARFELAFDPAEPPVLRIERGGDAIEAPLAAARTIAWTVRLAPGRYPLSLHVVADGGDVAYTACLDVQPAPVALDLADAPFATTNLLQTLAPSAVPVPADAAECAPRWNDERNAIGRGTADADGPSGAFVRLVGPPPVRCGVWIVLGDGEAAAGTLWVEVSPFLFIPIARGTALRAEPDWALGEYAVVEPVP